MTARDLARAMRTAAFERAMDEATRPPWVPLLGGPDPRHPLLAAIDTFTPFEGYMNSGMLPLRLDYPDILALADQP